jgi:hypothetical protein
MVIRFCLVLSVMVGAAMGFSGTAQKVTEQGLSLIVTVADLF